VSRTAPYGFIGVLSATQTAAVAETNSKGETAVGEVLEDVLDGPLGSAGLSAGEGMLIVAEGPLAGDRIGQS